MGTDHGKFVIFKLSRCPISAFSYSKEGEFFYMKLLDMKIDKILARDLLTIFDTIFIDDYNLIFDRFSFLIQ